MPKAINGLKTCSKCKETKPVTEFSPARQTSDGLASWCRACVRESSKRERSEVRPYNREARPFAFELIDEQTARVPVKTPDGWRFTLIDAADVEIVAAFKWNLMGSTGYVYTYGPDGRIITMHRMLLGLIPGDKKVSDHINGDRFDNRRANLRITSYGSNIRNVKKPRRNNSTGYVGVYAKRTKVESWIALCYFEGKAHRLGTFKTPEDAARAYDRFVIQNLDAYAFTNFPRDTYREQE